MAERISCFCEAILDVDNLCKSDLRCCVAKKLFEDNDEVSADQLIIPKNDERCKEGEEEERKKQEEEQRRKEEEERKRLEEEERLRQAEEAERKRQEQEQ